MYGCGSGIWALEMVRGSSTALEDYVGQKAHGPGVRITSLDAFSAEDGELPADNSMELPEIVKTSLSGPVNASTTATTGNVPIITMNFQPLRLCESKEDARRVAALRMEVGKVLPVCMVTRSRETVNRR